MTTPPVCNYEGSDYQTSFWEKGGRAYEDACEAIALKKLLPASGAHLLELGAHIQRAAEQVPLGAEQVEAQDKNGGAGEDEDPELERIRAFVGHYMKMKNGATCGSSSACSSS